ncbi:Hsp20/alpha crystallin family protein [Halomonas ramblicola]|uniref:Hsp20/alpha crystallin family protein n=1 Tax=Halomonas ramblicola TaxID=747349 RepID=UPI0025B332DD|nr:Hsp20/alpha crystallin family protein [Halomonas ramblicola]MDN3520314.1 Hsp20/alpha crystallin family protein [Halomonas ramblicola]
MNEITRRETTTPETADRERRSETLLPAVDIHEGDNAVEIVADMPGVTPDTLCIEVDNGVLSLEGEVSLAMPEGLSPLYAEVRAQRYARRFTLSREIDSEAISARIDNGVVHLTLPRKDSHRRRRIEVQAA